MAKQAATDDLVPTQAPSTIAEWTPKQLRCLDNIPPKGQRMIEEIRDMLNAQRTNAILERWYLGDKIVELQSKPDEYGAHDNVEPAMEVLFGATQCYIIRTSRLLRQRYTLHDIEFIMSLTAPDTGAQVSLTLLTHSLEIADREEADKILKHALASNWTTRDLRNFIRKSLNKGKTGQGRKPISSLGIVEKIDADVLLVRARSAEWIQRIVESRELLTAGEQRKDSVKKRCEEMEKHIREVREQIDYALEEIARTKKRLEETYREEEEATTVPKPKKGETDGD